MAVTKLDVLAGMDELKVCTAYRIGDKATKRFPNDIATLERVEPIYETLPGFDGELAGIDDVEDLPADRENRLCLTRSSLFRGAARGITLDDENFT